MKNCDIYVSVVCVFLHFVLWAVLATFRHPADGKVHIVLASHLCTCVLHRQWCNLHTLKLPQFFYFHGDFHQKRHFAHPEVSLAHPELPFLAKSMKVHIVHISYHICDTSQKDCTCTQQGWGQVLFEVLESSTSTFSYLQVQVQVQVLRVLGRHQVHQVLFQSSTSQVQVLW